MFFFPFKVPLFSCINIVTFPVECFFLSIFTFGWQTTKVYCSIYLYDETFSILSLVSSCTMHYTVRLELGRTKFHFLLSWINFMFAVITLRQMPHVLHTHSVIFRTKQDILMYTQTWEIHAVILFITTNF